MLIYANPFHAWAELLRGLHGRFLAEMRGRGDAVPSLYFGEILGAMAGMISQLDATAKRIDALERTDPAAFEAFQRAIATE